MQDQNNALFWCKALGKIWKGIEPSRERELDLNHTLEPQVFPTRFLVYLSSVGPKREHMGTYLVN